MATRTKATTEPNAGLIFLNNLRGTGTFPLKRVAKALFDAKGEYQEALLQRLRDGQLIASARWPRPSDLIELPSNLWHDVETSTFKVRVHSKQEWKTFDYSVPAGLLLKHVVAPRLAELRESGSTEQDEWQDLERLLSGNGSMAEVVITATNARLFADNYLGPTIKQERRGRNRTSETELLLIEMFRRLHLVPSDRLPPQKVFVNSLTDWWNSVPERPARGADWVHRYVKLVWAALKSSPRP